MLYFTSIAAETKKLNPDYKVTDIAKSIGEQWAKMPEEAKKTFNERSLKEKEVYLQRLEAWKKDGFFKFEDGSLSNEACNLERVQKMKCADGSIEPKKPSTAFMYFIKNIEVPDEIKKDVTKRSKYAGEKWQSLSDKDKVQFE